MYFFKRKSETQQTVIDFANEAQRQHNAKTLTIRSDNGTEFKNYTLDEFLSDEGIKHQYAAPYTPQQNGVAERKNRTLMDAARTMMAEFKSQVSIQLLGRSHQHRVSCIQSALPPQGLEQDSI